MYDHDACGIERWVDMSMHRAISWIVSCYIHNVAFTSDCSFKDGDLATLDGIVGIALHVTAHVKSEVSLQFY